MEDSQIIQNIEVLIFSTEQPISIQDIRFCLKEAFKLSTSERDISGFLEIIKEKYQEDAYFFELAAIAGGYQFLTKSAFHSIIGIHIKHKNKKRLSTAALETLSIIAYKQPVTKLIIEKIRGVNCDYAVQKLLGKELVTILGRSDAPGRPLIYGTSAKFMDYFGLNSIKDLPKIKEFKSSENEIGSPPNLEN